MTPDQKFFYEHAGYSVAQGETTRQGKLRSARELAKAEAFARNHGWEYSWEEDVDGCIGCDCGSEDCACASGAPHEVLCCVLKDGNGAVLASLCGICEPTREYGRVVEAELASEAMAEVATAR